MSKYFRTALLICVLSIEYLATTTREIEMVSGMWDKSNHFIAFFVLYLLISFAYQYMKVSHKILWLMAFAIQIEVVQHFIEGRFFSLVDVVADSVGMIIGVFAFKFLSNFALTKKLLQEAVLWK